MISLRLFGIAVWRVGAVALALAAAPVSAQTIYRNVDASGNIAYSDRFDSTPSPQPMAAPDPDVTQSPAGIAGISSRRTAALVDAKEAARRLRQAQLNRKQGLEPMPGERGQGTGADAVNYRYWYRQEMLRRAVENAQRRTGETHHPQVAGR